MSSVVPATKSIKPIDLIRQQLYLPTMKEQLTMALPTTVSLDKFLRVAVTALQNNPSLLSLDRGSLFASVMTAAQLGLLPDAQLGEAYFVPFKGRVQLIPGYRGLIKLARQGDIGFIEAETIHANDRTLYVLGDDSRLEVKVAWGDRGPITDVYAVAKYRDGTLCARRVMSRAQVDEIRARSQAANGPAWSNDYEEMMRKTVLRRIAKYLPLTTEAQTAFRVSELTEEMNKPVTLNEAGQIVAEEDETTPAPEPKRRRRSALDGLLDVSPQTPVDQPPTAAVEREPGQDDDQGDDHAPSL